MLKKENQIYLKTKKIVKSEKNRINFEGGFAKLDKKQNQTRMSRNAKKVSQNLLTIVENFGKLRKMR